MILNNMRDKLRKFIKDNRGISKFLLAKFIKLHNYSYHKISEYAGYLNNDIHPKHDIIKYHQFYVDNLSADDIVLDLGCGNGFLSYDMAKKAKEVVGIEIKDYNIKYAKEHYQRDNLKFIVADATEYEWQKKFDKIALSNVLEHIEDRITFLKKIKKISDTIILRVPMINREWLAVYKKENGFEYKLDNTHYIEYTLDSLQTELKQAGWQIESYQVNWGEFWGVLKVKND
jgi:2-polyprenyl-3-methyl-5-hydroxy-6-metoxy-1,4-benzoquinol methylase